MLTRKHFKAIAEILKEVEENGINLSKKNTLTEVAEKVADYFANENPRFNRTKFLEACKKSS